MSQLRRQELLNDRERQVLSLVATGQTSKSIARSMEIAPRQVDLHINQCLHKLGARNRAELIAKALSSGELPDYS